MTINILLLNCYRQISKFYFIFKKSMLNVLTKKTKTTIFALPKTLTQECISNGCNA